MSKTVLAQLVTQMTVESTQFKRELERTTAKTHAFSKSQKDAATQSRKSGKVIQGSFGGVGRSAGQASIQVQQMVGQISGGVNPMIALSQQSADLGFVMGVPLLGAVVSIGAALSTMLLPNLFESGNKTEELSDKIKELRGEYVLTENQLKFSTREEQKANEIKQKRLKEIDKEIIKLEAVEKAQKNLASNVSVGGLSEFVDAPSQKQITNTTDKILALRTEADNLNQELGKLDKPLDFSDLIKDLTSDLQIAKFELQGNSEEAEKLRFALSNSVASFSELPDDAKRLYNELTKVNQQQEAFIELQKQQAKSGSILDRLSGQLDGNSLEAKNQARIDSINQLVLSEQQIQAAGYDSLLSLQSDYIIQSNELYAQQATEQATRNAQQLAREQEQAQAIAEFKRMEIQAKREYAVQGFFQDIQTATSQNKKLAGIAKAAAIVQATYQTYQAANNALAAPFIPPIPQILAGAAVAAGLANVAKIKSTPIAGAREMGGPVSGGKTYLVGEKGPELFTPGATGQITSNANLQKATGQTGNTINYSPVINGSGLDAKQLMNILSQDSKRFGRMINGAIGVPV